MGNNAALGAGTGLLTINSTGLFDLHGGSPTIGAISGAGTVDNLALSTTSTLTAGNGNGTSTFSGTIQNTVGIVSLVKAGSGTLFLTGSNTYSGTTTVSGGMLEFTQPAALYSGSPASWLATNITAGSGATLAVSVGGTGFTPAQAGTLVTNLTGSNSGLLAGAAFGIDTSNAAAPAVFSILLQDSAAGSVGLTKLGAGILQVTNANNSYTGPTTVLNGQLMLSAADTDLGAPGLVTVTNSTSGGLSILALLNHNALGSGGAVSTLAPISLNSTNGGTAILEIGAALDPTAANSFSYMVVPAGQIPTGGQISLGSSGNTQDVVGFSASNATYAPRTVGLYTSTSLTTLQTLQRGTYLPGNLVLGSSDANTTLVLENPIDLYSASAGSSVLFSSIRGTASPTPEGEYAGAIGNSSSAPVSVTFGGSGGLIFASSASTFNATSLQLAGGGLFITAPDHADGQTAGPLGTSTAALVIGVTSGSSATASGANLAFMTDGPNSRIIGSSPSALVSNRNIIVNPVAGSGSVVLGGFTDDYTAMNGSVQLNGPATFYAAASGRVDFTGPISGSGAVQIGGTAYVEGVGSSTGIPLGTNGTIAFTGSNSYSGSTTVASGRFLVNGSLYASSPASTITVSAGTLGGTGTISGAVTIPNTSNNSNVVIEAVSAGSPLTLAAGLTVPYNFFGGSTMTFQFDSLGGVGQPGLVVENGLNIVGPGNSNNNLQYFVITGQISGTGTYALMDTDSSGTAALLAGISNGTFVLNALLPNRAAGILQINPTNAEELDLVVNQIYSVAWTGNGTGPYGPSGWTSFGNFLQMGGFDDVGKFQNGDAVVFSDSAANTTVILNSGNVSPSSMTFQNHNETYTISGTGEITSGNLSLTNGGTLIIENTDTFTGLTSIGPGATLQLGNGTAGTDGYLPGTAISDSGSLVYSLTGQQSVPNPITGPGR